MTRLVLALLLVAAPAAHAQVTGPVPIAGTTRTVSAGPGAQTDPHTSGSLVSYTNRTNTGSEVRVFDLATGLDIGLLDPTYQDSISDISGQIVVFTRRETSTSTQTIVFVNLSDPALTVTELAPLAGARCTSAAIGADTVAFQQFTTPSTALSAVCVVSLARPSDPAQCLTSETLSNMAPAVSPDGSMVVFQQCATPNVGCDINAAHRQPDGSWSEPIAITSGGGNDLSPDTNGTIVVYSSDAAAAGDFDVYYKPVNGTGTATRLELTDALGSDEENPNISGAFISMERTLPGSTGADLYLFDLATNTLFQLPPTPDVDEHLNDISVQPDGTLHVVWAHTAPLNPLDGDNLYAVSFNLSAPSYLVCPLFDASRSFKAGRVAPLKIQLCDASGANLSSLALVLTATALAQIDSSASTVLEPESPGQANADGLFRYDAALGGYVFNLSTAGLSSGTWELQFRVAGDTTVYGIRFDVK
jgi:WD40-like Beta Propeller Repeat